MVTILWIVVTTITWPSVLSGGCNYDGELLPNNEDCRKYFKCANGAPSKQVCPGTLIFDTELKICNWPQSTSCNIKPKPVKIDEDDLLSLLADESPVAPTVKPTTERNREKLKSLFHTKDRDFKRLRDRHRNLRQRMRERARKEEEAEKSTQRSREPTFRQTDEDESNTRGNSFANRGSTLRNRGSTLRNREPDFGDDSSEEVLVSSFSRNRNRQPALSDEEDDNELEDTRSFRNRDSTRNRQRGDLDQKLSSRGSSRTRQRVDSDDKLSARDKLRSKLRSKFSIDLREKSVKKKTRKILKPIVCDHDNELHANPQSCRKYFKCSNGLPSLQSCPTNLIYDSSLKVCNWPDATECIEDPDAVLPELGSSDRHPPKPRKSLSTISTANDDNDTPFFVPAPPPPSSNQGRVPSKIEAMEREELLKNEYPLFKKVRETVRTLDTDEVEKIRPNRKENPDNVKRVEFILSEDNYEELFPRRHPSYTYTRFIQAIGIFPAVCSYVGSEKQSDDICRKTLATMFAHFAQETGNHNPSDKEYEEWRQGLAALREQGCTDTSPGCGYNENCEDKDSLTKKWACGTDRSGKWKKYYGRGAKQLSYNFNYGQFSQAMFGDGRILLDHPDFVADTWLNMASATWFYATPQPPKPSMLHVIDGTWVPNQEDRRNGIKPGFGATINIINGGLECNKPDGRESNQARNRIEYYKQFAWYLYVDYEDEELGCANQQQFSAGGAGALPIYWDKDWQTPYSCKLVNYQTAHSALVQGEYIDCVEENFKVNIR